MDRRFKVWYLLGATVITAGILVGVVLPSLSGEHYDYFNVINLDPNSSTQAMQVSLNSSDTLFYQFRTTSAVVFWVVDPAGNIVVDPLVYVNFKYGSGLRLVAQSSGVYSLVFSSVVPDQPLFDLVTVEVRSGVSVAS